MLASDDGVPMCSAVDPPCVEITPHLRVCRCAECGALFTIQLDATREIFGYYDDGRLIYVARTRNGFTPASAHS